ncbi:hypothetical protein BRC97_06435 [Halobacteriales archaeon QS_6_71_20]|nr:MAG: hypothetical protein BRC97_06435 [Halobacteriales archaeon QS_6_71_20]
MPLVGVALAPLAGHLTWANRGHAAVGDGFVARAGVFRRRTRLVPYFRLQTVFVARSAFQRRRDLASVVADSASSSSLLGGDAVAYDLDDGDADTLRGELLDRLRTDLAARRRGRDGRSARRARSLTEPGAATDGPGNADGVGADREFRRRDPDGPDASGEPGGDVGDASENSVPSANDDPPENGDALDGGDVSRNGDTPEGGNTPEDGDEER